MADDPNVLPPSAVVRWMLLGAAILGAVGLYFRWGTRLSPVGTEPPAEAASPAPTR